MSLVYSYYPHSRWHCCHPHRCCYLHLSLCYPKRRHWGISSGWDRAPSVAPWNVGASPLSMLHSLCIPLASTVELGMWKGYIPVLFPVAPCCTGPCLTHLWTCWQCQSPSVTPAEVSGVKKPPNLLEAMSAGLGSPAPLSHAFSVSGIERPHGQCSPAFPRRWKENATLSRHKRRRLGGYLAIQVSFACA